MGKDPRHFRPWSLIEVSSVTLQNRFLLRPSARLNDLFVGVVARAQSKYDMKVICLTVLSSHYHMVLVPRGPDHLAAFMGFVNTNLSKEVGALHRWPGTLFPDPYHHIEISDDETDQIRRLKYCLANSVKEFLVDHPSEWPGVHSADALVRGEPLLGHWYNRTKEYAARQLRREPDVDEEQFASEERLMFSPLPCWASVPEAVYRERVAELLEEIENEGKQERQRTGKTSLGARKILRADPHHRPDRVVRSPQPRFHARDPATFKPMFDGWREVIVVFREASARLLSGERGVKFPEGTFPPHLPFVPFAETMTIEARGQPA